MKEELQKVAKPIANRVRLLRHNVFAHRSIHMTYRQAMEKAAVTSEDLQTLIEIYARVSDAIEVEILRKRSWLSDRTESHTRRLLADLSSMAASPTKS